MSANLIIFIDGFPFEQLKETKYLRTLNKIRRIPMIGYSFTLYLEMFYGLLPDESGLWCEYSYDPPKSPYHGLKEMKGLLKILDNLGIITVAFKRFLTMFTHHNIQNVPLRFLPLFRNLRYKLFEEAIREKSIQSKMEKMPRSIIFDNMVQSYSDELGFEKALKKVVAETLFLSLTDLDAVSHQCGVGSRGYINKIEQLDKNIEILVNNFLKIHKRANIVILSDHGFVNIAKYIEPNFSRIGELKELKDYIYFVDSTMIKFWTFSETAEDIIYDYLKKLTYGRVLNNNEREENHITSKGFGNLLFLLNKGCVFYPSFYGGLRRSVAMHGYGPEVEEHQGIFLYQGEGTGAVPPELKVGDTYKKLIDILNL